MGIFGISGSLFGSSKADPIEESIVKGSAAQLSTLQKAAAVAAVILTIGAIVVGSVTAAGFIGATLGAGVAVSLLGAAALVALAAMRFLKQPTPVSPASLGERFMQYAYQHPGRVALGLGAAFGLGAIAYYAYYGVGKGAEVSDSAPTPAPSQVPTPSSSPVSNDLLDTPALRAELNYESLLWSDGCSTERMSVESCEEFIREDLITELLKPDTWSHNFRKEQCLELREKGVFRAELLDENSRFRKPCKSNHN